MSVIRKIPFIQTLVADLSSNQKKSLLDVINGEESLIPASFSNMPASAITPVLFQFDANNSKTGILVLSSHYRVLIAYHRFQDLLMFKLNSDNTYEKVNEYLDINELRRLVEELDEHITTGEIDTGSATMGQVLSTDGAGDAVWVDAPDLINNSSVETGDAVKMLGFDSEGNIVADTIPEGITVSNELSPTTEDVAVSGPAVAGYAYSKDETDSLLSDKANIDGNYPTMTVGFADNLTPYDSESGDDQDEPFSFQATGTANGTQSDFATGSTALMNEKRGNTVVVNQWVPNNQKTFSNGSTTDTREEFSFAIQVWDGSTYIENLYSYYGETTGLKFLLLSATNNGNRVVFKHNGAIQDLIFADFSCDIIAGQKYLAILNVVSNNPSVANGLQTKNVSFIKLTQWFNGDIPQDLLDHPENFFRYYQGSLAYNTGELVNANGRYIKCIGRQQWDEETKLGYYSTSDGEYVNNSNYLCSKNKCKVVPNAEYYCKCPSTTDAGDITILFYDINDNYIGYHACHGISQNQGDWHFTVPSNTSYFYLYITDLYGTTYNHDITISIYYSGESGYDKYYPYEVLTNTDTGTETLRSAGSVADYKTPNGVVHRLVGSVDMGTLDYTIEDGFFRTEIPLMKVQMGESDAQHNVFSSLYSYDYNLSQDFTMSLSSAPNSRIWFRNDAYGTDAAAFKTAMSGVYLFYELAEPTTEQGTTYSANLIIDDFGSMDFSGTNGVPQGNLIFYPVDYKAFVDTLYDYTEGTPSNIALKSDLNDYQAKMVDLSSEITDNASLTYDLKKAYKIGNMVFLTIRAKNGTASQIAANTNIITLSNNLTPPSNLGLFFNAVKGSANSLVLVGSGVLQIREALAVDEYIYINIAYAVA